MAKSVKLTMLTGLDTGISLFSEIFCCYPNYPSTSIQTFQFWTKHPSKETVDESHWLWNNLALSRSSLLRQGHASPQLHIVITDTEQPNHSLFQMQAFWRCCLAWKSTQKVWPSWHCWHWLGYVQSQKSNIWRVVHKCARCPLALLSCLTTPTAGCSAKWTPALLHKCLSFAQNHVSSARQTMARTGAHCVHNFCKACIAIHIAVRHAAAKNALTAIPLIHIDCKC